MDYTLAKQLYDAGFPSSIDSGLHKRSIIREDGQWVSPHLSELIEACGERDFRLELSPDSDYRWTASIDIIKFHGTGKTPEIAVARLWIALNE